MKSKYWYEDDQWTEEDGTVVTLCCSNESWLLAIGFDGESSTKLTMAMAELVNAEVLMAACKNELWGTLGARVYLRVFEWASKHRVKGFEGLPHWWAFEELKRVNA